MYACLHTQICIGKEAYHKIHCLLGTAVKSLKTTLIGNVGEYKDVKETFDVFELWC